VLSVYTRYVLPMLFGPLGTIAAAMRDIQSKVRDSTLLPRDFALSLVRLPLGVMAGLAVVLFLSPWQLRRSCKAPTFRPRSR
jgi:hypothetical protein